METFDRLTKEEQWGQALWDLRVLYESGDRKGWHAALFTLRCHAWAVLNPEEGRNPLSAGHARDFSPHSPA
jgi:hypothetical protein